MDNIIIIGGDRRQEILGDILSAQGYAVRHVITDEDFQSGRCICRGDTVILPAPVSKDRENIYSADGGMKIKIYDVLEKADSTNMIFAGSFTDMMKAYMKEKNISYRDYFDSEELILYNAYLTGVGAVKLLQENSERDLRCKKVLITGYGRVARFTAQEMMRAGCDVYVCARNKVQLTEAECTGCKAVDFDKKASLLYLFDYILNTVPENIFSYEDICHIKGVYVELASLPYGAKREYFKAKESNYIFGGSLPGRYLPYSAAEKLAELTVRYLSFRNGGD